LSQTSVPLSSGTASNSISPGGNFGSSTVTASLDGEAATTTINFSPPGLSVANAVKASPHSGSTIMNFTVTLSAVTDSAVTVSYATADGTATSQSGGIGNPDYLSATGTVTFNPGVTTQKIPITIYGYTFNEPVETFTVNLFNASSNSVIIEGTGTGTIDNTNPKPALSIVGPASPVNAGKTVSIAVNLSTPSDNSVTVKFSTVPGTALANTDFKPTSGVLTFTPGITTLFVTVKTILDAHPDAQEQFNVVLTTPGNATLVAPGKVTVTINAH
jgi:hypothetical protein